MTYPPLISSKHIQPITTIVCSENTRKLFEEALKKDMEDHPELYTTYQERGITFHIKNLPELDEPNIKPGLSLSNVKLIHLD